MLSGRDAVATSFWLHSKRWMPMPEPGWVTPPTMLTSGKLARYGPRATPSAVGKTVVEPPTIICSGNAGTDASATDAVSSDTPSAAASATTRRRHGAVRLGGAGNERRRNITRAPQELPRIGFADVSYLAR